MADSNLAVNASLPASYILDFYSIMTALPCAYPFVIVTTLPLFLVKSQGLTVTYSNHCFLCSNLHLPRPVVSTHKFVMTFFPDEFESTCHEVEGT